MNMNKSFFESFRWLNEPNDSEKDLFILIDEFEQESHERRFVLIKLFYLFF